MTRWFLFMGLVLWVGCTHDVGEPSPLPAEEETETPNDLIVAGCTDSGAVALFDGNTGAILSLAEGGGGVPRDLAVDPWRQGVWVFEENEDASGGEIRFCPLVEGFGSQNQSTWTLASCDHAAWVDGLAGLFALPEGLWVFEHGVAGARWKVLRSGFVAQGIAAPRPASLWMDGETIGVLSYGVYEDRLLRYRAKFESNVPEASMVADWGMPASYPPTTRYVKRLSDTGLLFDAMGNDLWVRGVSGEEVGVLETWDVGRPVGWIEAAALVGENAVVLGADTLWVVAVGEEGVENVSGLWLDGDVRRSSFFSRNLAVATNRVFVGTNRGIRAVGLKKSGGTVGAEVDDEFVGEALRGPMDVLAWR